MPRDTDKEKTLDDTVPNGNGSELVDSYFGRIIEILPGEQRVFVSIISGNQETHRTLSRREFEDAKVGCFVNNQFGYDQVRNVDRISHRIYKIGSTLPNTDHFGFDLSTYSSAEPQPSS